METIDWLRIQEELLVAQLRIVRKHMRNYEQPGANNKTIGLRNTSQVSIVYDILMSSKRPLHINEIINLAEERYGIELNRESVVSALIKKLKRGSPFIRTGPNTFGLQND